MSVERVQLSREFQRVSQIISKNTGLLADNETHKS